MGGPADAEVRASFRGPPRHEEYGQIVDEHGIDLVATGYDLCATLSRHPAPAVAAARLVPHPDWRGDAEAFFFHAAGQAARTLCPEHAELAGILNNRFFMSM
jgi:hypothetical protein